MTPQELDRLYAELRTLRTLERQKPFLKRFFVRQVERRAARAESETRLAFEIAGLASLSTLQTAVDADPYLRIVELAGQVDLPPAYRTPEANWDELTSLIRAL
ncbi:hypothetical protein ABZ896_17225 [Streptomyces sp. NPDC047072]|uniref:hypothetical protein n=1 Tax=Streptomyces sp. NPDC047072 TaxID=3154809 RepID=UPI0033EC7D05